MIELLDNEPSADPKKVPSDTPRDGPGRFFFGLRREDPRDLTVFAFVIRQTDVPAEQRFPSQRGPWWEKWVVYETLQALLRRRVPIVGSGYTARNKRTKVLDRLTSLGLDRQRLKFLLGLPVAAGSLLAGVGRASAATRSRFAGWGIALGVVLPALGVGVALLLSKCAGGDLNLRAELAEPAAVDQLEGTRVKGWDAATEHAATAASPRAENRSSRSSIAPPTTPSRPRLADGALIPQGALPVVVGLGRDSNDLTSTGGRIFLTVERPRAQIQSLSLTMRTRSPLGAAVDVPASALPDQVDASERDSRFVWFLRTIGEDISSRRYTASVVFTDGDSRTITYPTFNQLSDEGNLLLFHVTDASLVAGIDLSECWLFERKNGYDPYIVHGPCIAACFDEVDRREVGHPTDAKRCEIIGRDPPRNLPMNFPQFVGCRLKPGTRDPRPEDVVSFDGVSCVAQYFGSGRYMVCDG